MIEVPIDHGHDYFKVQARTRPDSPDGSTYIFVELWSRGTFTVAVFLSEEDAIAFGEALIAMGKLATEENS